LWRRGGGGEAQNSELDSHRPVGVDLRIVHLLAHIDDIVLDLLGRPAQAAGKEGHGEARQAGEHVLVVPHAQLLELGVLGPSAHGPRGDDFPDIGPAGLGQALAAELAAVQAAAEVFAYFEHQLGPFLQRRVLAQGVVVTGDRVHYIGQFDISTGRGMSGRPCQLRDPSADGQRPLLESLLEKLGPIY
jgi:hypothetical protein